MPYVEVFIHAVWGTKNRYPFMNHESKETICDYITSYALEKDIIVDTINGYWEHMHCLFRLNTEVTLAKHMQFLKGGSAFWINNTSHLFKKHFGWADEYFAASVSRKNLSTVRKYIRNQEAHHSKLSFQEEYDQFLRSFGFFKE